MFGKNWSEIQKLVKTRSNNQIRSHAQKVFKRLRNYAKRMKLHEQNSSNDKKIPKEDINKEWIKVIEDPRFAPDIYHPEEEPKPDKGALEPKLNEEDYVQSNQLRRNRPTDELERQNLPIKKFKPNPSADLEEELKKSQHLTERADITNPLNYDKRHNPSFNDSSKYVIKNKAKSDHQVTFSNESESVNLIELYEDKANMLRNYVNSMIANFNIEIKLPSPIQIMRKLKTISDECGTLLELTRIHLTNIGASNSFC